jgi:hypothetical protein
LLIKDDNDILSEWIAYHYHVFSMRRLIVAMDPDSKTSPLEVLEPWSITSGNFDLNFTLWNDEDYTPAYFHKTDSSDRDYTKLPNSVTKEVTFVDPTNLPKKADVINRPIKKTIWHRNETYVKEHQDEVRNDVHQINNHRFRQKNFVSECFRQIKREREVPSSTSWMSSNNTNNVNEISWAVHIDTDEFLVPNPWIASYVYNKSDSSAGKHFKRQDLSDMLPETPSDGSLWTLYHQFLAHTKTGGCVMMPRILFGSREDAEHGVTTASENGKSHTMQRTRWSHTKFESLRWQYHSDFESDARPKSIVDVSQLIAKDDIFRNRLAKSIHRPLAGKLKNGKPGCSAEPKRIHNPNQFQEPLAVYHYLGSLERYLSRGDVRRDPRVHERYDEKANYARGDENHPVRDTKSSKHVRWWIGGWLDSFVETHGTEKAYAVLGKRYATQRHFQLPNRW